MTTAIASPTELAVIAHRIRSEWAESRDNQVEAWRGYMRVGALLMKARERLADELGYGQWFKEQDFGFSRQWAGRLIEAAENRPDIERLLETAVSSGAALPGVNALLATLRVPRETVAPNGASPPALIYDPDHHSSVVVEIIVTYPIGPTKRQAGQAHGSGADRREWHAEIVMQESAPTSLIGAQPFATEIARRFMRELLEHPLETMLK